MKTTLSACALLRQSNAPAPQVQNPVSFEPSSTLGKIYREEDRERDDRGRWVASGGGGASYKDGKWVDENGKPLGDDAQKRLKELKVPKAWTNVQLAADPRAALQVIGKDSKGRSQYRYSAEHSERAAAEKYARLKEFHEVIPVVRKAAAADMAKGNDAAAVTYLIDRTGFRIGSDRETLGNVKAYGATTLTADHVRIEGNKLTFEFTGKKGVRITKEIEDAKLARYLEPRVKAGGRLFPGTDDASVRSYLKGIAGDKFKVKDYRTWHGTSIALQELQKYPEKLSAKEFKRVQAEVSKKVAAHLGNTPLVARKSYIDPAVWHKWEGGVKKFEADSYALMAEFFDTHSYDKTPQNWRTLPELDHDPDETDDTTFLSKLLVDERAHEAATSPRNDLPLPTPNQIAAGVYRKGGVISIDGMRVRIENPEGSVREGVGWRTVMKDHYGYFLDNEGSDGDKIDAFLKPGMDDGWRGTCYVVDQVKPDGTFDEHKCLLGYDSIEEARHAYSRNYSADWRGLYAIHSMPFNAFKVWLRSTAVRKPLSPELAYKVSLIDLLFKASGPINDPNWPRDDKGRYLPRDGSEGSGQQSPKPEQPKGDRPRGPGGRYLPKGTSPTPTPTPTPTPVPAPTSISEPAAPTGFPPSQFRELMFEAKDGEARFTAAKAEIARRLGLPPGGVIVSKKGEESVHTRQLVGTSMLSTIDEELDHIGAKVDLNVVKELSYLSIAPSAYFLNTRKQNQSAKGSLAMYNSERKVAPGPNGVPVVVVEQSLSLAGTHMERLSTKDLSSRPVSYGAWIVDNTYNGIFRHEFGHHVHASILDRYEARQEWKKLYASRTKEDWKQHVSRYASANEYELFAESFAAWTHPSYDNKEVNGGRRLPKEIEDYFEKWVRAGKSKAYKQRTYSMAAAFKFGHSSVRRTKTGRE